MDGVIGPHIEPDAFAYLDDIIVVERSLQEHLDNLRAVLRSLRNANLRLNKANCSFFQKSIIYQVSESVVHTEPSKIAVIKEKPPTTVK